MSAGLRAALVKRTPNIRSEFIDAAMETFEAVARTSGTEMAMVWVLEELAPKLTRDEMGELAFRLVSRRAAMLARLDQVEGARA